jgi:hypothetical protein
MPTAVPPEMSAIARRLEKIVLNIGSIQNICVGGGCPTSVQKMSDLFIFDLSSVFVKYFLRGECNCPKM